MFRRAARFIVNLLWGDVNGIVDIVRIFIKIAGVIFVAWLIQRALLFQLLAVAPPVKTQIEKEFTSISGKLGTGYMVCVSIDGRTGQDGCAERVPGKDDPWSIKYNIWKSGQKAPLLPDELTAFYHTISEIKYGPFQIYRVEIIASLDSFLRSMEAKVYGSNRSGVQYDLCAGTREVADPKVCELTDGFRAQLVKGSSDLPSFDFIINRARLAALLIGPIQFGTLSIFLFALVQMVGLWLRFVVPGPTLYEETVEGGIVRLAKLKPTALDQAVIRFSSSNVRSLSDSLYARVLTAADSHRSAIVNEKVSRPGKVVEPLEAGSETPTATLESYRTYLEDDAASRQDIIEVLGDTMLKLAFLGTVFGISSALYAARSLDTADPLTKLVTKSEMYSGIGVGFGATLVGIALSIITGLARSGLSRAWSREISTAYRLILDGGIPGPDDPGLTDSQLKNLRPRIIRDNTRRRHDVIAKFGILILLAGLGWLIYVFKAPIEAFLFRLIER